MRVFIFAALLPVMTVPAFAQGDVGKKMAGCTDIADAGQRLACFDALALEIKQAGDASFGTVQATKAVEPDRVSLVVSALNEGADGRLRFVMENGQVWRQVDTTRLRNLGKGPWTADIRKAALGSFLLTLNDGRPVRVERVN